MRVSVEAGPRSVEEYVASLPQWQQEAAHHVLLGGFNRRGRPVGFHHAPGGVTPPGRRIDEVVRRFPNGAYLAKVSFYDLSRGWVQKPLPHTMFPDDWTAEQVTTAGFDAYAKAARAGPATGARRIPGWSGSSGGQRISGYRRRHGRGPATFYPDPERER
ncbi:MAG: EndoU domain-containing protein [Candidatus Dormiibacterota bacterium]